MQILCLGRFVIVPYWLVLQKENSAIHTKAMPKYVASNMRGPKLVWVPSKSGWSFVGTMALETWFNEIIIVHLMLSQVLKPSAILSQCQVKIEWSPYAINIQVSYSSCGNLLIYLKACK